MRRTVLPLAALGLLAELVLLSHGRDSSLLPLIVHGSIVAAGLALGLRTGAGAGRGAVLAVAAAAAGLLALEAAHARRGPTDAASAGPTAERVEDEARVAREAFESFFAGQRTLVGGLPPDLLSGDTPREDLFERLVEFRDRQGERGPAIAISIYDADGVALAWVGETSALADGRPGEEIAIRSGSNGEDPARAMAGGRLDQAGGAMGDLRAPARGGADARGSTGLSLAQRAGTQFARREPLGTRLYTVRAGPGGPRSRLAVAEALLDAPFDPEAWRRRVTLPASMNSTVQAEFLDPAQPDAAALGDFLSVSEDLYWKRGGGAAQLLTGLRGKNREFLGLLTLSPEAEAAAAAREANRDAAARLLLLLPALSVLIVVGVVSWRSEAPAAAEWITFALTLAAIRLALRAVVPWLEATRVFDFRLFSSQLPYGLAGSPGDLLASSLCALGFVALLAALLLRAGPAGRAVAGVLSIAAAAVLWRLTPAWVSNSSLNPVLSPFLSPVLPRLALATSHATLVFAAGLLALTALSPKRLGWPRSLAPLWLAAATVSYLVLARQASHVPPGLIERSLAPEVLRSRDEARERLGEVLAEARDDSRWDVVSTASPDELNRLTFEAWRTSPLGRTGSRSALAVLDLSGRVLGSFAYGLPEKVFADADSARAAPPRLGDEAGATVLTEDALRVLRLRVPLLRGDVALVHDGRPVARLAVLLSREWDNLPFLTLRDPLLRTLGAGSRESDFDEYFGGAPLFLAYSLTGQVLFPAPERAAPLSSAALAEREPKWVTTSFEGHDYRTYLFQTPEGPRALGYAASSALAVVAGLIRSLVASLLTLAIVLGVLLMLTSPEPSLASALASGGGFLAGSYYRRLLTVVLASSLVPLLLLAVIFRNSIEQQSRDAFEREGVSASATIGRLLEDYAASAEASGARSEPIESRTLFWIGRTVHQDVHLFTSDRLLATSRGDPEASGLRTFRLNAEVARTLARSRPPQFLANEPAPERAAVLVYALVRLEEGAPEGVLAVPLILQERVLAREAEKVADALLTATVCLGLVLSGIGYLFARRLSVPIRELSDAASEIAAGRLDVRVQPRGRDEIRRLVDAFNGMAAALADQREDLRRRRDYIEAILLNVTTGVISTDAEGRVRTSNPAASLLLGLPADLAGRDLFAELGRREDLAPLIEHWRQALRGAGASVAREIPIVHAGSEVRLRSIVLPLRESEATAPGRIFLVEDVTEVMRSNRLAAWAEMARGIAHEIKNPLTPIQLSAEHLLRVRGDGRGGTDDPVLRECVDTILDQVRTLREISSDFSTYARLPVLRKETRNLGELVRATIAPYRTGAPAGIRIDVETEDVPPLAVDERVLRRALVNLVENALQAMEGGGTLTVTLRGIAQDGEDVAEIRVTDTGIGMDDTTRARVFEPYFSTRDSGVGLGLAIARRSIEEHGGTLTAESEPGRGTRMIVRLPYPTNAEDKPRAAARPPAEKASS